MTTLNNGVFTFEIPTADLAKGLRPSRRNPRNVKFLTICNGAVALDNVLQVLADLESSRIDHDPITGIFPYPQIFVFTRVIIVCSSTDIYELVAGSLVHKLGPLTAGIPWSAVDFHEFIYMSNGVVAVVRHAESQEWEVVTSLPIASCICNLNGQVFIGSPGVEQI